MRKMPSYVTKHIRVQRYKAVLGGTTKVRLILGNIMMCAYLQGALDWWMIVSDGS